MLEEDKKKDTPTESTAQADGEKKQEDKEEEKPKEMYPGPHSKKGRLTLVYSSGRHKIRKRR